MDGVLGPLTSVLSKAVPKSTSRISLLNRDMSFKRSFERPPLKNAKLTIKKIRKCITVSGAIEDPEGLCSACQTWFNVKIPSPTCPLQSRNSKEARDKVS